MISVPFSMLVMADKLGTKGNSGLLCGLDISGNSPSDKGCMVKIDFTDVHAVANKQSDSFILDRLPLSEGVFKEKCIQSECLNSIILVSPVTNNKNGEAGFITH